MTYSKPTLRPLPDHVEAASCTPAPAPPPTCESQGGIYVTSFPFDTCLLPPNAGEPDQNIGGVEDYVDTGALYTVDAALYIGLGAAGAAVGVAKGIATCALSIQTCSAFDPYPLLS